MQYGKGLLVNLSLSQTDSLFMIGLSFRNVAFLRQIAAPDFYNFDDIADCEMFLSWEVGKQKISVKKSI